MNCKVRAKGWWVLARNFIIFKEFMKKLSSLGSEKKRMSLSLKDHHNRALKVWFLIQQMTHFLMTCECRKNIHFLLCKIGDNYMSDCSSLILRDYQAALASFPIKQSTFWVKNCANHTNVQCGWLLISNWNKSTDFFNFKSN